MNKYYELSLFFKALAEPARLQILDILSCGTVCACEILKGMEISQSTLSHHMKVLTECGLVSGRKEGTWMHYSINRDKISMLQQEINELTGPKEKCICESLLGKVGKK
jgi:ArsR family transcriptional regulator